jgi:hypothetical protein
VSLDEACLKEGLIVGAQAHAGEIMVAAADRFFLGLARGLVARAALLVLYAL